jgi:urease accessory protein
MSAVPVPGPADLHADAARDARWHARLALDYRPQDGRSVVASSHAGPLRVLKPLYPEDAATCQSIIVHPPGGIAGGDALTIDVLVRSSAQAQITTPGAAKWYKANRRIATQDITLRVDGALEWLPQEAIVFDEAQVRSTLTLRVTSTARVIGWDIVALGRTAAGEAFRSGSFRQTIRLVEATADGDRLHWIERMRLDGDDPLLESPIGLAGAPVFGCLWAWGPAWSENAVEALRAAMPADAPPVTVLAPQLLVARTCGATTQHVRGGMMQLWQALRPLVLARAAVAPRIWAT